ncbi:hypothetical protein BU25DRAFT_162560 [Macroventuria anomochaeta]|uniref:Uncharacterized protein n=1 Tax=Macroventuria anomochaeta TaxID=301207 RepID=A0ACB6RTB6_9PLEO|nr:uncharacterized protein BU25DRAFT_162560 [Macroventuria anomochaeta]KAF2624157.1 hypothetical protein BU25DRAFT_162560 [Macroventuria anomochaeta]
MRPHSPSPFPHRKESCVGVLATHALYLSSVSLSPRSLTPAPLQHAPGTLHFASSRARCARSSRGLPVGPGPSRAPGQGCSVETQVSAVHEPAICGYDRSFAASSTFSTRSISHTTGPLVVSQDPLWLLFWREMELAC